MSGDRASCGLPTAGPAGFQSVLPGAAGIETPATPPPLKSVDSARFGGPTGILTGLDQHVCYSMDHMASSVDTFNPKVARSRLARPTRYTQVRGSFCFSSTLQIA